MADKDQQPRNKFYEPKLMLPNFDGGHYEEYIPGKYGNLRDFIMGKYVHRRGMLGLKIYYWQIRQWFLAKERKVYDLQFLLHVEKDHDGKPELPFERLHYRIARFHYGNELDLIRAIDEIPWKMEHSKDIYLQKDLYIKAYKKKWLDNFDEEPEWKLLYHGVDYEELVPHLDKMMAKYDRRIKRHEKFKQ